MQWYLNLAVYLALPRRAQAITSASGNGGKVLHNVVGGHLGVFAGNGGDLRIGLPLQSLHGGRAR